MYFDDFQFVHKGDTLVMIENFEYKLKVEQAKANYQKALMENTAMGTAISATANNLTVSDANIEELRIRMNQTKTDYQRYKQLYVQKAVTRQQYDNAKADYEAIDPWRNFETIEEYDFTVGVEEAVHGEEIAVVTDGNSIVVTGDNAGRIEVYSVNGRCVYCGHETTIGNLTKGVYVVKVNNNIFKVLL